MLQSISECLKNSCDSLLPSRQKEPVRSIPLEHNLSWHCARYTTPDRSQTDAQFLETVNRIKAATLPTLSADEVIPDHRQQAEGELGVSRHMRPCGIPFLGEALSAGDLGGGQPLCNGISGVHVFVVVLFG